MNTTLLNNNEYEYKRDSQVGKEKLEPYMICSGEDTIQVNTQFSKEEITEQFAKYGYSRANENSLFVELKKGKGNCPRLLGFKNGKIIFHMVHKGQIVEMLSDKVRV